MVRFVKDQPDAYIYSSFGSRMFVAGFLLTLVFVLEAVAVFLYSDFIIELVGKRFDVLMNLPLISMVLTGIIYPIQGYWNWGGGFLKADGYSDFAGSGTVHLAGAACALAAALFIGPRLGKYGKETGKRFGMFSVAETKKLYHIIL